MNKQRMGQISVSFLIVLSFFVSATAACICSHHIENIKIEAPSCHEHSETKHHKTSSDENVQQLDTDEDCCCVQPAPRTFSKSETVKIEKQTAVLPLARIEISAISTVIAAENTYFEKPFYLSDSARIIKSSRPPPRL